MKDDFQDPARRDALGPRQSRPQTASDWARLEEIGDLHFHASAYATALDYYTQMTDGEVLDALPRDRALPLLRKSVDAMLLLGHLGEADALLDEADALLARTTVMAAPAEAATLAAAFQIRRAIVLRERGRLHDALNLAKRAFAVLALTDEHADVARLQVVMGVCHLRLGRLEKADELFNDGLATFRRIGHDLGVANLLNNLALLDNVRCRWDRALAQLDKALELSQRIGASHLLPMLYLNQGIVLQKTNRLSEARSVLEKGHRLAASLGDRLQQCRLSLACGRLETLGGRLARAEELLLDGQALAAQHSFQREATIADEYLGDVLLARGEPDRAIVNYRQGMAKSRAIASGNDLEGELLRRLGEAHLAAGRLEDAVAASTAALGVCEQCGEVYEIGFCHLTLGQAFLRLGDVAASDEHFRLAVTTFHDQKLPHLWCRAVVSWCDARLSSASEPQLLVLRRLLAEAQERVAAGVSDSMLCQVLDRLAGVQVRLGQFDDALLTAFDLERYAGGLDDPRWSDTVLKLRATIERGILRAVGTPEAHFEAISTLPGLFDADDSAVPRNLDAVLVAGMDRVGADSGFIAMVEPGAADGALRVVTRRGLTENLSGQLARWFVSAGTGRERGGISLHTRLGLQDRIVADVPALMTVADSCLFMPIALHDRRFGVLFLGKSGSGATATAFDRSALDFLATYLGFLALFLHEKCRTRGEGTEPTPFAAVESFENIITQNVRMLDVLGLARKVAPSELTVLLNGETGTGKGLLAYSIHALSRRAGQRFLAINCAAIPETLLESELFGHKRGSFTGAHADKKGLLAEAEGGTVFLDEIGKMPFSMQGKLLHFMDTKVVRPVGSNQEFRVDVRVICASKNDLHQLAREGAFLEDLYYRLLDFPLVIPPLRERPDDVELLASHFVARFSRELGIPQPAVDHRFMEGLVRHPWPGNVRELEKTLQRAIVLASGSGTLRLEHLPADFHGSATRSAVGRGQAASLRDTLAEVECREIRAALQRAGGNKSQAARDLGISYPNLLKKARLYGLQEDA
ncbi:MAG: sigma 54-interacting transcriptional regulator [bacterium]|nr:sigma 54-interacting transcriptional regulator [bacterium]